MKARVLGDRLLVEMFRITGIPGETPSSPEDAERHIEKYLSDSNVGVVLVGSSLASAMGPAFRRYLQRRKLPLVLRIPDRQDRTGCADEIRDHLQRTLGIRL